MTALKLRTPVPFPARVQGSGGIAVSKGNGIWTVEPDFSGLAAITGTDVGDPRSKQVWIYDPSLGEYNVLTLAALGDALFLATSTTILTIGTGSKVFTIQAGKDIGVGSFVIGTSDAAPSTNYMFGQVTAYSGTTLTVNVTVSGGSGMHGDWTIRAAGSPGATGSTGAGYIATSSTSNSIASSGSKSFTTQAGLAYTPGARVRASETGGTAWMEGVVTSYSGTTLTFTADKSSGAGTFNAWNVNVAGQPGAGDLTAANNLSDIASPKTGYDNLSVHGADVTATATIDLDSATGYLVDVTGNTGITAVTLSNGRHRLVRFTGTPQITHGANLVLQGAANIAIQAGDYMLFVGYASSVVRGIGPFRASGRMLHSGVTDTLAVGYAVAPFNAGTKSTGTFTPDPASGNMQYATNNGAHTLAAPSSACSIALEYTNGASAGAITASGFTRVVGGFDTTNGNKFAVSIIKNQNSALLVIQPLQ